jgi:hypothetical protein
MSTVKEIAERIAREDDGLPPKAGWPTDTIPRQQKTSWAPSRKVWAVLVTGIVSALSAYLSEHYGYELNADGVAAVTAFLMTAVGYITPDGS